MKSLCSVKFLVLLGSIVVSLSCQGIAAGFNPVFYRTGFELSEGFSPDSNLQGQSGWQVIGIGQTGILTNFIAGSGQQAYIGYSAAKTNITTATYAYVPLNILAPQNNGPIKFSVNMEIADSSNNHFDNFNWEVFSDQGTRLFTIFFDNSNQSIWYNTSASSWVDTGVTFNDGYVYNLSILLDLNANKWSAQFGGVVLATNQIISASGSPTGIGDIDAVWGISDPQNPGDNYMFFDDYSVTVDGYLLEFTEQPASWAGIAGDTCQLSAQCAGKGPISYQWWFNGTNKLRNATNAVLNLTNIQASASGSYQLVITNNYNSVTSYVAQVTVLASPVIYQTSFESSEGYQQESLNTQNGWGISGPGGCGVVTNFLAGYGQQAYIGYNASASTNSATTLAYRSLGISALPTNGPITFSVVMAIVDSSNSYYDWFDWFIYDENGNALFTIDFSAYEKSVWYSLGSDGWTNTHATYAASTSYTLSMTMDSSSKTWSAKLDDVVLATNIVFSSKGFPSGICARWNVGNSQHPGNNYMLFDNCKVLIDGLLPVITTNPQSWIGFPGTVCSLDASAGGKGPFSYQWSLNASSRISNATNASFNLNNIQPVSNGKYTVTVTNGYGSVTSKVAAVQVLTSSAIYQTGFEASEGYSSSQTLAGQLGWEPAGGLGSNGIAVGLIPGRGQSAFLGGSIALDNPGYMSVRHDEDIQRIPAETSVRFSTVFSIKDSTNRRYDAFRWNAFGDGGMLFRIELDNLTREIRYWTAVSNWVTTTQTLTNDHVYSLKVDLNFAGGTMTAVLDGQPLATAVPLTTSGKIPRITSFYPVWEIADSAHPGNNLMVFDDFSISLLGKGPVISADLADQTAGIGGQARLSVAGSGNGLLSYAWFFNNQPLNYANTNTLLLTNFQASQAGSYYVVVSDFLGSTISRRAQVTQDYSGIRITPALTPGEFGITITTARTGLSYFVEYKDSLDPAKPWQALTNVAGAGVYSIQQPIGTNASRFFRLITK